MRIILTLFFVLLLGCTHSPASRGLKVDNQRGLPEPKLQYLGVGGWLIHWGGEGVLIAPMFSNPGLPGFPPLFVSADEKRIADYMPHADDVTMLLVGHAHYDHLLDVPTIMDRYTPKARVFGSETMAHILRAHRSENDPRPLVDPARIVEPSGAEIAPVGLPGVRGTWFYSIRGRMRDGDTAQDLPEGQPLGRIRAMPIASEHAGHVFRYNFLPGAYDDDLGRVPTYIRDWKLGHHTFAWLIDLLDEAGRPVYRIHFQDSAANPPYGFPPLLADSKAVDVEILCAASWNQVDYYPNGLLQVTRPSLVLLGHWENFFGNDPGEPARTIPLLNYAGLIENIEDSGYAGRYKVLEPLSEVAFPAPR
ncbi:MBL fold metallo-hydrolase [Pseudomonas sp. NPDC086581]|uniref:MBL fold metallo-hydrolase n=1 Tax=Pseudomonas sp. NPDC086581 TaxID=3364432 RepID=UPI003810A0EF